MSDGVDEAPGLQNERTALAWRRTALACLVVGALLARQVGGLVGVGVLVAVALAAGGVDLHAHRRYRHRVGLLAADRPVSAPADVVALTAIALALSATAMAAVVAP